MDNSGASGPDFKFREYDALALRRKVPGDRGPAVNHVGKHKQAQKGLEVVFDPKGHREYLTGFRKRKQQRRMEAAANIKQKERQDRNNERAEKRAKLKEELGLGDDFGVKDSSESEGDDDGAGPSARNVKAYQADGLTTTVTVTGVALNSDDEQAGDDGADGDGGDRDGAPAGQRRTTQQKQNGAQQKARKGGEKRPPAKQALRKGVKRSSR